MRLSAQPAATNWRSCGCIGIARQRISSFAADRPPAGGAVVSPDFPHTLADAGSVLVWPRDLCALADTGCVGDGARSLVDALGHDGDLRHYSARVDKSALGARASLAEGCESHETSRQQGQRPRLWNTPLSRLAYSKEREVLVAAGDGSLLQGTRGVGPFRCRLAVDLIDQRLGVLRDRGVAGELGGRNCHVTVAGLERTAILDLLERVAAGSRRPRVEDVGAEYAVGDTGS